MLETKDVNLAQISLDELKLHFLSEKKLRASVLRLDKMHPQISGNKWFKLKDYLAAAKRHNQAEIITFGGAYSNHILATAAACYQKGIKSVAIIRGDEAASNSPTLQEAKSLGMELYFISRQEYRLKNIPDAVLKKYPNAYNINEGGYGVLGMMGSKAIMEYAPQSFTHVLAAVGTGTTLAGLVEASGLSTQVIGISALKNYFEMPEEINALVSPENKNRFQILHDYSFGGYAKHNEALLRFMNDWYRQTAIPSDFVYTGKLFYAFQDLCEKDFFPGGAHILLIHSGGLQGNRSLPNGTLIF